MALPEPVSVDSGDREAVARHVDALLPLIASPRIGRYAATRDLGIVLKKHPGALKADQVRRVVDTLVDALGVSLRTDHADHTLFVAAWESLEPLLHLQLKGGKPAVDAEKLREISGPLLDALDEHRREWVWPRQRIDPQALWTVLHRLVQRRPDAFTDGHLERIVDLEALSYGDVAEAGDELVTVDRTLQPDPLRQLARAELRRRAS